MFNIIKKIQILKVFKRYFEYVFLYWVNEDFFRKIISDWKFGIFLDLILVFLNWKLGYILKLFCYFYIGNWGN
jgi:hypothetical protein